MLFELGAGIDTCDSSCRRWPCFDAAIWCIRNLSHRFLKQLPLPWVSYLSSDQSLPSVSSCLSQLGAIYLSIYLSISLSLWLSLTLSLSLSFLSHLFFELRLWATSSQVTMLASTIASWVGHRMWEPVSVAGNFQNIIIA